MISVYDALDRSRGGSAAAAVSLSSLSSGVAQHADHPIGDAGSSPAPRSKWHRLRWPPTNFRSRVRLAWCIVTRQPVQLKLTWGDLVRYQLPLKSEPPVTLPATTVVDMRFAGDQ